MLFVWDADEYWIENNPVWQTASGRASLTNERQDAATGRGTTSEAHTRSGFSLRDLHAHRLERPKHNPHELMLRDMGILPSEPAFLSREPVSAPRDVYSDLGRLQAYFRVVEACYFHIRNTLVIVFDRPGDVELYRGEMASAVREMRTSFLLEAHKAASYQEESGKPVLPFWVEDVLFEFHKYLTPEQLETWQSVRLRFSHDLSLKANILLVDGTPTCKLSILFQSFLKNLYSFVFDLLEFQDVAGNSQELPLILIQYHPVLLAHFAYFRDYFPLGNIPQAHPLSSETQWNAKRAAEHALRFVLLHELAHVHLGHHPYESGRKGDRGAIVSMLDTLDLPFDAAALPDTERNEFEADLFALNALSRWDEPDFRRIGHDLDLLMVVLALAERVLLWQPNAQFQSAQITSGTLQRRRCIVRAHLTRLGFTEVVARGTADANDRMCSDFLEYLRGVDDATFAYLARKDPNQ